MKIIFEMDVKERWRKIKNYPAYKVSNFGRIKRVEDSMTSKAGKILKSIIGTDGYFRIDLYEGGNVKKFLVHCLVAKAFLGQCPKGKETNHIDGNKGNPCVDNLEYVTKSENCKHAFRLKLKDHKGEHHPGSKLKEKDILEIKRLYKSGNYFQKEIAKKFNVTSACISYIINNKVWKHIA